LKISAQTSVIRTENTKYFDPSNCRAWVRCNR